MKLHELLDKTHIIEMANLKTPITGVNGFVFHIIPRRGKHGPRVKFSPGNSYNNNLASSVGFPNGMPTIMHNNNNAPIGNSEFAEISKWMLKNKKTIISFWEGEISTEDELLSKLKKLENNS